MHPKAKVAKEFDSKGKLVDRLLGQVERREGESKDDLKKRLMKVSNQKLLRLQKRVSA